jgi:hypothetical protein
MEESAGSRTSQVRYQGSEVSEMTTPIALFYARKDAGGGSTSFTVHLMRGMQKAGLPATLYRFSDKPKRPRELAGYTGIVCEYVTPAEARKIVSNTPSLLLAAEKSANLPDPNLLTDLMIRGMRCVIHDPNEFNLNGKGGKGYYDHLSDRSIVSFPIGVGPAMKQHFEDVVVIPHPYYREMDKDVLSPLDRRMSACSIARLTFVKRPKFILDANRMLAAKHQIRFHSAENRLCTFSLRGKYPELTQGGYNLPLEWGVSARAASIYRFAIDMTYLPMEGGRTQYSFLEAWDAGTVNVIHKDWLRYKGEMKDRGNCWAVESADEIASLIRDWKKHRLELEAIRDNGIAQLKKHDAAKIARRYYEELTK